MDPEMEKMMKEYAAMDSVATEILTDKQQIVDLDAKRNKGREALRNLKKTKDSQSWMCFGNTFIKMETSSCVKKIEEESCNVLYWIHEVEMMKGSLSLTTSLDQKTLDTEIERLRDELKPRVSRLHMMEGEVEAKGFDLKGMRLEHELTLQK